MNRLPFNLFTPNQDWEALPPILFGLSLAVIVVLIWFVFKNYALFQKSQKSKKERFFEIANRYRLNKRETNFLYLLAKKHKIKPLTRLLFEQDRFERSVYRISKGVRKKLISTIREKLFGKGITPSEGIHSTTQLTPGTRLLLKYLEHQNMVVWGHLVDNDSIGLVIVIPNYHEIRIPLRPETLMEVTAYIPEHQPVLFRSWVKSVIPGPRKMIVLGHSNFVTQPKSGEVVVGPQTHSHKTNGRVSTRTTIPESLLHV